MYFRVHFTKIVPRKIFCASPSDGQMAALSDTLDKMAADIYPPDGLVELAGPLALVTPPTRGLLGTAVIPGQSHHSPGHQTSRSRWSRHLGRARGPCLARWPGLAKEPEEPEFLAEISKSVGPGGAVAQGVCLPGHRRAGIGGRCLPGHLLPPTRQG